MTIWAFNSEGKMVPRSELNKRGKKKKQSKLSKPESLLLKRRLQIWPNYQEYCKSKAFSLWKKAVLIRDKYKCQLCGGRANTAHHKKYRKWGTEELSDGFAICNTCHTERVHLNIKLDKEYAAIMGDSDI